MHFGATVARRIEVGFQCQFGSGLPPGEVGEFYGLALAPALHAFGVAGRPVEAGRYVPDAGRGQALGEGESRRAAHGLICQRAGVLLYVGKGSYDNS